MSADDHLNPIRIRQMAALRRAAIRSRSYCVIALGGCIVTAADFIFFGVRRLRSHPNTLGILIAVVYFFAAVALLILTRYCVHLALRFHREANQSALPPPVAPPDFSTLQDGSQVVKDLEDIR
ncbi:MAG TPA: hypothetical protein VHX86_04440 [Tepidisphaeraceae bacterium]|jgi:hypothetical protein|nr:hypothetical protein [Tepidisphaeraceae bacterium]